MAPISKKVVIIGCGYGGSALARELDGKFDVTVIDMRGALWHSIASLRGMVDAAWADRVVVPNDRVMKKGGRVVHAEVTGIDTDNKIVQVDPGEVIPYDYLVVATGAHIRLGMPSAAAKSVSALRAELSEMRGNIRTAKSIVIVGGGPTGIELAAEIRTCYADKDIHIAHNKSELVSNLGTAPAKKFRPTLLKKLEGMNVHVHLGERASGFDVPTDGSAFVTGRRAVQIGAKSIETDLVVLAVGQATARTDFLRKSGMAFDETWRIKVTPTLESESHPGVYAIGDCNNVQETNLAFFAGNQAKKLAAHLLSLEKNGKPKPYKPMAGSAVMLVTLGPNSGVMTSGMGTTGDWMVRKLKGKDLLCKSFAGSFGYPVAPLVAHQEAAAEETTA